MIIEYRSIIFVVCILILAFIIIKKIADYKKIDSEIKRKTFHISLGLTMLTFPYIFKSIYSLIILAGISIIILLLIKYTKLKNSLGTVLYGVERESLGEIFFVISVFTIFYLSKGDAILYSIPILILTFADSFAALIGKNYGKNNLSQQYEDIKSIEGSFGFFIVAFISTLVPLLLFTTVGREELLLISIIIGLCVALVESISHTGNDNLLIPLTTYAFLTTLMPLNVYELRINLLTIFVIFVLVLIANSVKNWSKLALVEALIIGYLTVILYDIYAIIPPLILFLTVMRFPKVQEKEKSMLYDARIIETNVVVGIFLAGLAAILGWKEQIFMIYSLAFSMHLTVNSFIRFKYYFNYSEYKSVLLSFLKGFVFIFIPSIIIQKITFNSIPNLLILSIMTLALFTSSIIIMYKKRDKEEEITVKNGYMQMRIVLELVSLVYLIQYLYLNGEIIWNLK